MNGEDTPGGSERSEATRSGTPIRKPGRNNSEFRRLRIRDGAPDLGKLFGNIKLFTLGVFRFVAAGVKSSHSNG